MIMLDINKDSVGIDFIPVVEGEGGIRLASNEEKEVILNRLNNCSKTIQDGTYKDKFSEFCQTIKEEYMAVMGYTPSDPFDKYQHFAHFIDCEAHFDVIRELFKTWNETNK